MPVRLSTLGLALLFGTTLSSAQESAPYQAPRTAHGFPDLQGVWKTDFITMMERPEGVTELVLPPEAARNLAAGIRTGFTEGVTDPEFEWTEQQELTRVNGEYRSSIVIYPADGKIPYSEHGLTVAREKAALIGGGLDGPEQRPLEERCLASMGYPPLRTLPIVLPRLIVQTRDHLLLYTEDSAGFRLIRIGGEPPGEHRRSFSGHSIAEWEGETLVVTTTHFRGDYPERLNIPLPILLGANARVTERFTRVADDAIHYHFTVEDSEFYSEPWQGEFTMGWLGGQSYEYGCHEGNYSLPGALRGGIVQALDAESALSD